LPHRRSLTPLPFRPAQWRTSSENFFAWIR
jgi:hypothetical protein